MISAPEKGREKEKLVTFINMGCFLQRHDCTFTPLHTRTIHKIGHTGSKRHDNGKGTSKPYSHTGRKAGLYAFESLANHYIVLDS